MEKGKSDNAVRTRRKTLLFSLVLLMLTATVVEVLAFSCLWLFRDRFSIRTSDYLVTEEQLPKLARRHNPDLGWDTNFSSPFGERPKTRDYGRALMTTFGDSNTYCGEVGPEDTWQEYLSEILQADVYNFGVGGYGTDQAYLKYREKAAALRPAIVALGLITENMGRVVNSYRPFYNPETGIRLPKPRFELEHGALVLKQNPILDKADLLKLTNEAFLEELGRKDFWYRFDRPFATFTFPYSRCLVSRPLWDRVLSRGDDRNPRPREELWRQEEYSTLMFAIFRQFVADVSAAGATPIIVLLPQRSDVRSQLEEERPRYAVGRILDHCEAAGYHCFEAITALADNVKSAGDMDRFFPGHISAGGNRIIAVHFAAYLKELADELGKREAWFGSTSSPLGAPRELPARELS